MPPITLSQLKPHLAESLQQRANRNGRSVEAEIAAILESVLTPLPPLPNEPNLAAAIQQRFAEVGGVELPEIPREPIRKPPAF